MVSEGVAVNALRTLMTRDEERDWLTGDLARVAGLDPQDVQAMLTVNELQANLKGVNAEAPCACSRTATPRRRSWTS
ncbi:hypothetical protein CTI14_38495 [Methylobacterium radiotolerans]|nr:hypothetical protein CTI14_38495 [Methylobacterium radiotolerans]